MKRVLRFTSSGLLISSPHVEARVLLLCSLVEMRLIKETVTFQASSCLRALNLTHRLVLSLVSRRKFQKSRPGIFSTVFLSHEARSRKRPALDTILN